VAQRVTVENFEAVVVPDRPDMPLDEYGAWGAAWLYAKVLGATDEQAVRDADGELAKRRAWRDREASLMAQQEEA